MQIVARKLSGLAAATGLLVLFNLSSPTFAFTPDSPEVTRMVRRAARYLAKDHLYDEQVRALAALALFKAGEPVTHPLIKTSIEECLDICKSQEPSIGGHFRTSIR